MQTVNPRYACHPPDREVDEWKIQRTLQMVREMGARDHRQFPLAYAEHERGSYAGTADRIIRHAENRA